MRRGLATSLPLFLALAACSPSPSTAPASPNATAPSPAPETDPVPTVISQLPGTTDTDWGRIWNALPPSFPLPSGSSPAEIGPEPATAAFDIVGSSAEDVVALYRPRLEGMGYAVTVDGPLEDGSLVLVAKGPDGGSCVMQISAAPLGGLTRLTILYGASCPAV